MTNKTPSEIPAADRIDSAAHPDYLERVYAGVLGKIIGVYLGRPVENWSYERIAEEIGDVDYYIHEKRDRRLIVTDDDISGTFTFLRALEDYDYDPNLTPEQIGQTWLNYLIERTTILWWGGLGNSTEHTAYLRLKNGIPAPQSGSAETNTLAVAEQIGAQIFIDGWGMICPADPKRAVDFACRAATVSHDGEAIYGAQVVAALVAEAFIESDIDKLLDRALSFIPAESMVATVIADLRKWHASGIDWRAARAMLESNYGYDKFAGQCPLIPNHGLIILGLLWGAGDFDESMLIVNTCGWDTDCNSGNLGAILGVRNGLENLGQRDWRGPVADRLYSPSADSGRSISDAAIEAIHVANAGRILAGHSPFAPKIGARFHFALAGSVQGWRIDDESRGRAQNILRYSQTNEGGLLIENLDASNGPVCAFTPTFIPPDTKDMVTGYVLVANPTLYPSQVVRARLVANGRSAKGRFFLERYGPEDDSIRVDGPEWALGVGESKIFEWTIPWCEGYPIHLIGLDLDENEICLDWMDWNGVPNTSFPPANGTMWGRAWGKATDRFEFVRDRYDYTTHNDGPGLLIQGQRKWRDYRVEARVTPKMATAGGIAVRVQGLRRYVAFAFGAPGEVRFDQILDGTETLAIAKFDWDWHRDYEVAVEAQGSTVRAFIDGRLVLVTDGVRLVEGAFGLLVDSGCFGFGTPSIRPL